MVPSNSSAVTYMTLYSHGAKQYITTVDPEWAARKIDIRQRRVTVKEEERRSATLEKHIDYVSLNEGA